LCQWRSATKGTSVPLTIDSIIQEVADATNTTGTSINVTLPSGTTAGNTVEIIVTFMSALTPPAGMLLDKSAGGVAVAVYRKPDVTAGEGIAGSTPYTFTFSNPGPTNQMFSWLIREISDLDLIDPLDASAHAGPDSKSNGQTMSTGTTPLNAGLSVEVLAAFAHANTDSTWSGYTNNFEELADTPYASGSGYQLAVARKFVDGMTGQYETTATLATAEAADQTYALIVAYRAADSPIAAPLAFFTGFSWGTHGGMGSTAADSPMGAQLGPTGTWGTNYSVVARGSGYALRITQSAAAANVYAGNIAAGNPKVGLFSFDTWAVSGSGVVVTHDIINSSFGIAAQVVYNHSTNKFGVRAGSTGTIQYETGTTALDTRRWIDLRVNVKTATWTVDWRIETGTDTYIDQTQATLTGQSTSTSMATFRPGSSAAQTAVTDTTNICMSVYSSAYPLGPHSVKLLKVDPAGTPTVSGTTANFSVFTANGTLAAWNATNARNAVDEVPPTVSASADGVVQTVLAASDYMQFPMDTYTCASDEVIAAVRMVAPMWGGTGTGTGTLGIRGYDGTTETTLVDTSVSYDAASPTALAAAAPVWRHAMWPSVNGWTQTELDNAVLRVGFSTDATPDMGVSALYLEVATRKALPFRQITMGDNDEFTVDIRVHPYTSGSVSYLLGSTDATRGATFNYAISGTPQTPVYVAPSSTQVVVVNAASFGDISDVSLEPDP
jgi:hypothetical protein